MRAQTTQTVATIRSSLHLAFLAIFTTLACFLIFAANAFAAGGGAEQAGKNLGDLLGDFGQYITLSVAGLIALGMIIARKFSSIGSLLVMVFLVMSLFVSGDEWVRLVENTMKIISRGV